MAVQRVTVAGKGYAVPGDSAVCVVRTGLSEYAYVLGAGGGLGMITANGPRPIPQQFHGAIIRRHYPRHARAFLYRGEPV